jgi:molybdate transport system permease protein
MTNLAFLSPEELAAVRLSVQVALGCVVLLALPGIALGWLLARCSFPGKLLLDATVHLPLVLPPVVVGYLLLLALGRSSLVGGWLWETTGLRIGFTWRAAVLASAVMGFPLLVRSVRLAIELADPRFEEAARTLGAGPLRTFLTVTVPLAAPGILTGLVLAFARSLGEFGATITFAGNVEGETRTLPLAIYSYTQTPGADAPAVRLVVVAIVLSFASLLVSEALARRMKRTLG